MKFERLEFCWPPLRGPAPLAGIWANAARIWAFRGHVVVAVATGAKQQQLYCIDAIPSPSEASASVQSTRDRRLQLQAEPTFSGPAQPLHSTTLQTAVVAVHLADDTDVVLPNRRANVQTLYALREAGQLEIWRYIAGTRHSWECIHVGIRLGDALRPIADACIDVTEPTISVYYTETRLDLHGRSVCDLFLQTVTLDESDRAQPLGLVNVPTMKLSVSAPRALANGLPDGRLKLIAGGLALLPAAVASANGGDAANDQLFFWAAPKFETMLSLAWGIPLSKGAQPFESTDLHYKVGYGEALDPFEGLDPRPTLVAATVDYATRELVFLESTGRLVIGSLNNGTLALTPICSLPPSALQSRLLAFVSHRTRVALFSHTACRLYSLRTGTAVADLPFPSLPGAPNIWTQLGPAQFMGVWSTSGAFQIQMDRIGIIADVTPTATSANATPTVTTPATPTAATTPTSRTALNPDNLLTARYWARRRQFAKYLLDAALDLQATIESRDPSARPPEDASAALFGVARQLSGDRLLQNPSVIVALLRNLPQYEHSVRTLVEAFLRHYVGSPEDSAAAMLGFSSSSSVAALVPSASTSSTASSSSSASSGLLGGESSSFIQYDASDSRDQQSTRDIAAVRSFQLHTALNAQVEPQLRAWLELKRKAEGVAVTSEQLALGVLATATEVHAILERTVALFKLNKTVNDRPNTDRARLEQLVRDDAPLVLSCVMSFLRLSEYTETKLPEHEDAALIEYLFAAETLIEGQQGRPGRPPLFELLCVAAIAEKPSLIPWLITLAHHCALKVIASNAARGSSVAVSSIGLGDGAGGPGSSAGLFSTSLASRTASSQRRQSERILETLRHRAIRVVVPVDPADILTSCSQPDEAADVIATLLVAVNEQSRALKFLLAIGRWEQGIVLARNAENEIVEQFELFHTLLTTFLSSLPNSPLELLPKIFQVQPRNYSVYDLLDVLRQADTAVSNGHAQGLLVGKDEPGRLTVEHVREQLVKMYIRDARKAVKQ